MPQADALHLARWTVTSGSNVQSRGAVVLDAGDSHWEGSAEGNGAVDHQVVMVEAFFVALFEDVAEAFGGDEGGPGALAFDEGIGGKGGAVDEDADIAGGEPGLGEDQADALDDAQLRRLCGGEDLAAPALAACFQHEIGEGAADIGGELDGPGHGRIMASSCKFASFFRYCKKDELAPS